MSRKKHFHKLKAHCDKEITVYFDDCAGKSVTSVFVHKFVCTYTCIWLLYNTHRQSSRSQINDNYLIELAAVINWSPDKIIWPLVSFIKTCDSIFFLVISFDLLNYGLNKVCLLYLNLEVSQNPHLWKLQLVKKYSKNTFWQSSMQKETPHLD